jgi:hypothetical protein
LRILAAVLWIAFAAALYRVGYTQTEAYFRAKLLPYPFEHTGMAVGAACFFLAMAVGFVFWNLTGRKKQGGV